MGQCTHPGGWQAIAPTRAVARSQYTEHPVRQYATETDATIPDGSVEVRLSEDDEWQTMAFEQAKAFPEGIHRADE
jgi:hypothetical protein